MDGGSPIVFDVKTPVDDDGLQANVRHALGLRLPTLRDFEYAQQEPLHVVANGPSAPLFFDKHKGMRALALNGALELFNDRRLLPDYWAACDPQELVTDRFLRCAPYDVTYLIASKCHPSVFERLSDRNVILWHVGEAATRSLFDPAHDIVIPASSSITSTSFELMTHLGYRQFETWGWDGCYIDGQGHAVPQDEAPSRVEITVHDRVYETSPVWALECDDIANRLVGFPFPIHIHGDGFFADMLSRVIPHRVTRD